MALVILRKRQNAIESSGEDQLATLTTARQKIQVLNSLHFHEDQEPSRAVEALFDMGFARLRSRPPGTAMIKLPRNSILVLL